MYVRQARKRLPLAGGAPRGMSLADGLTAFSSDFSPKYARRKAAARDALRIALQNPRSSNWTFPSSGALPAERVPPVAYFGEKLEDFPNNPSAPDAHACRSALPAQKPKKQCAK